MKELILVDGTQSGFTEEALTGHCIYFVRTTSGGTDGYLRINRKSYCKCEAKNKFLKRDSSTPLQPEEIEQVYENIGWKDQTTNIIISGLPSGQTAAVNIWNDGDTYTLTGDTGYTTTMCLYSPYTIEAETISGYTTPEKVVANAGRDCVVSHTLTYIDENAPDDDDDY